MQAIYGRPVTTRALLLGKVENIGRGPIVPARGQKRKKTQVIAQAAKEWLI